MVGSILEHMRSNLDLFACPGCQSDLILEGSVKCTECEARFPVENGIPRLFLPNEWDPGKQDVTEVAQAFYSENPFPNYDGFEAVGDLITRAERGLFAKMLNEQIPYNTNVLEVGCGTGQLSNYLSIAQRQIFGADMTLNSLELAHKFKVSNALERVGFYQMNLFRPIFKPESFDFVICNGVLHHTSDPFSGFQSIARLVKPGGYILIGLYNTYGRLFTDFRRVIFNTFGKSLRFLDPRLRASRTGELKKDVWYADQYENPHESKHTMGELLGWFEQTDFEFTYGIPNPKPFESFSSTDSMLEKHPCGNSLDHFLAQLWFTLRGSGEGGLYIMIARKK